ncbi:MAG: YkvA family protein [Pyrinomonadaceae bacterium]
MADIIAEKNNPSLGLKREAKGRMGNFLMFLPNMVMLLGRLLKDARVPSAEKALFLAAIVYVISPIDLIPDFFPFIGQVDDIYVVALTLLRLVNRSDAAVVRQHWSGGGDIVSLSDSIAGIAPMFLPKRVSRVLSSKVELGSAAAVLKGITNSREPLVVEIPQPDKSEKIKVDTRSTMTN